MRCGKRGGLLAWSAIVIGALILSVLILPSCFWWLLSGALLLTGGCMLLRK